MNKLLVALFASAFAVIAASALAQGDEKVWLLPGAGDLLPMPGAPGYRGARDAAKAKWDKMTPEEKTAMKKAAAEKKRAELTALEKAAQEEYTMKPLSKMETHEAKAAREAAKAKWANMTPEEQAAAKKAARAKKRAELTPIDEMANEATSMMPNGKD